ncbi:MAG TPA: hypothetical protein VLG74_04085, partial [Blastocatellia bacterium]|nr:hypothetical protein [Blastocatellia bacterium]
SAKLGMLPADQTPTPVLTSASLLVNGLPVQQAPVGQSGLRVRIVGAQLRADTQVLINGVVTISHLEGPDVFVELDENPAIKNSAGPLLVRARNTTPTPSNLSNELDAGRLVGPEITRVKVKKKAAGALLLKIFGVNFPSAGTVVVMANGAQLPIQSSFFEPPDFAQAKISAAAAPAPGTTMTIRLVTSQGIQSNEFTAVAK